MSSIIRNKTNLSELTNSQLAKIVARCIELGVDKEWLGSQLPAWKEQISCRKEVAEASLAYDLLTSLKTVTHVQPASPESKAWSNMEGGHIHHEVPKINVAELLK